MTEKNSRRSKHAHTKKKCNLCCPQALISFPGTQNLNLALDTLSNQDFVNNVHSQHIRTTAEKENTAAKHSIHKISPIFCTVRIPDNHITV